MKFFKTIVSSVKNELDDCIDLKQSLNFDTDLGRVICNETRFKILNECLHILFLCKKNEIENNMILIKNLQKRIKIHMYQLKKINTPAYDDNYMFFVALIKFLYKFTITGKITIGGY